MWSILKTNSYLSRIISVTLFDYEEVRIMNAKLMRIFSSCAMAAVLSFTSVTAQASETGNTECAEALTIGNCAANIKRLYTSDYPEQEEVINDIVDTLSSSDEFVEIFNDEGASAFQIVEDSLRDVLNPEPTAHMQTDDLYTSRYSFPNIQQIDNYSCGPASTLMALIGGGASGYYYTHNETITDDWQADLKAEMGTNSTGTYISQITRVLRENIPSVNGYTYKTKAFTIYSYDQALDFIETSLVMDAVPVIRVSDTSLLGYYHGNKYSHYMVVDSVDFNAECVTLVDPHYDNAYFGKHTISFDEFDYLAENCNDFWVSVYTKVLSDNSYEYV